MAVSRIPQPASILSHFELRRFSLMLQRPLSSAHGCIDAREGVLLQLFDGAGRVGLGEATPIAGFGLETVTESQQALQDFLSSTEFSLAAVGLDLEVFNFPDITSLLADFSDRYPAAICAKAALDSALCDLLARRRGCSVTALLAAETATVGEPPLDIQTAQIHLASSAPPQAMLLCGDDETTLLAAAEAAIASGYTSLKLKVAQRGVGEQLAEDLHRVAILSRAIDGRASLRLDANGGWSQAQALSALTQLQCFEVEFVEQPVATVAQLIALSSQLPRPRRLKIAADECLVDVASARQLIEASAVDVLVLKPSALGGLQSSLAIAVEARAADINTVVTTLLDGAVARAAASQLAQLLAVKGGMAHGLATGELLREDIAVPCVTADSGLGLDISLPSNKPWLLSRVQQSPRAPALSFDGVSVSFQQLLARCVVRALRLQQLGIRRGQVLALRLENSPLYIELLHSCTLLGVVLLPLNNRFTSAELGHPLRQSAATYCLCDDDELRSSLVLENPDCQFLSPQDFDADLASDSAIESLLARSCEHYDSQAILCIVYTSGTSGRPKGVPLSYRNFECSAAASRRHFHIESSDNWLLCMPLFHVGGFSIATRSAVLGFAIQLLPRFDVARVLTALRDDCRFVSLVPNMLQRLLAAGLNGEQCSQLKTVVMGGEALSPPLRQRAVQSGLGCVESYGLTESCSQIAAAAVDGSSLGLMPLPGVEIKIVSADGCEPRQGEAGEICLRGASLFAGYLQRARLDERSFFHSGDIGRRLLDGSVEILNRRSDLIISGGENIYPLEVENILLQHPAVSDVLVQGRADSDYGQRPMATIVRSKIAGVAEDNEQHLVENLIAFCRQRLAAFKLPSQFDFVDQIPRTASGKLIRPTADSQSLEQESQ